MTPLRSAIDSFEDFQKCLPRALKDFEDFPNNEGKDEVFRDLMSMVAEAQDFMLKCDEFMKMFFDDGLMIESQDGPAQSP